MVSEVQIRQWFRKTQETIEAIPGGKEALGDPRRIWNMDESGFAMDAGTGKVRQVFARKGAKHVHQRCHGTKEQVTVACCASAGGDYMPPLMVFPGKYYTRGLGMEEFSEALYGMTPSGWMTSSTFINWLKSFDAFLKEIKCPRPVILFLDGHASHVTVVAARFARENWIILFLLLQNSTFILQPVDVGIYSQMKLFWKQKV